MGGRRHGIVSKRRGWTNRTFQATEEGLTIFRTSAIARIHDARTHVCKLKIVPVQPPTCPLLRQTTSYGAAPTTSRDVTASHMMY